jgi:hypothetical protein
VHSFQQSTWYFVHAPPHARAGSAGYAILNKAQNDLLGFFWGLRPTSVHYLAEGTSDLAPQLEHESRVPRPGGIGDSGHVRDLRCSANADPMTQFHSCFQSLVERSELFVLNRFTPQGIRILRLHVEFQLRQRKAGHGKAGPHPGTRLEGAGFGGRRRQKHVRMSGYDGRDSLFFTAPISRIVFVSISRWGQPRLTIVPMPCRCPHFPGKQDCVCIYLQANQQFRPHPPAGRSGLGNILHANPLSFDLDTEDPQS